MKSTSLALLLVGTVIGAGFASGREILTFFGENTPLYVAPLCGALIFLCSFLFLSVGAKVKADNISEVNLKVMGKGHAAADMFLLFNSLVSLGGMLAAMDSLFSMLLPIAPAYSVISGILCAVIVTKGLKGLLRSNVFIVPVLVVLIVLICCFSINSPFLSLSFRPMSIPAAFVYVSMNMMLASTVFTTVHTLSKRQIIAASALAALIISAMMLVIILALNSSGKDGALPLMEMAKDRGKGLFYVSFAAIAVSIFTTMMTAMTGLNGWLKPLIGGGNFSLILVLIAGLIVSNLGFESVVMYLYPVIGILGIVYIGFCVGYILRGRKREKVLS